MTEQTTPQNQQRITPGLHLKRYWRIDEVAGYFAVSERTIYRLVDDGDLQAIRIRSCRRVSQEEIKRFEERLAEQEPF
ncbi:MAG: helix-turn-helix domain-containing protein [Proteobacteria bacterium]|nr:helix-turn-helix domain-containing protein [Pseudomonadota bacterium]